MKNLRIYLLKICHDIKLLNHRRRHLLEKLDFGHDVIVTLSTKLFFRLFTYIWFDRFIFGFGKYNYHCYSLGIRMLWNHHIKKKRFIVNFTVLHYQCILILIIIMIYFLIIFYKQMLSYSKLMFLQICHFVTISLIITWRSFHFG